MKSSHILITLLSMSILCGVHTSHGSDAPNRGIMQTITDSTVGQYLRACGSYIEQTPELRWRKLGLASSLLAPWVASFFSEKPYGLLKSLIPMYPAYQIAKDISVVRDIQLAQAGKKIPNERIKEYMHAVIDIDNRPIGFDSSNRRQFEDRNTRMFLMWSVIKEYGQHENNKNNLKECAHEVLEPFLDSQEYTGNLIEDNRETNDENERFNVILKPRIELLNKMLSHKDEAFSPYFIGPYDSHFFASMLDQSEKQFNIQIDTTSSLISRIKKGTTLNENDIKYLIKSFFETKYTISKDLLRIDWDDATNIDKKNRDQLKVLALYYAKHPEQIKRCALYHLLDKSFDRWFYHTQRKNKNAKIMRIYSKHPQECKIDVHACPPGNVPGNDYKAFNPSKHFFAYGSLERKDEYLDTDKPTQEQKDEILITNIKLDALFSPETTISEDSFKSIEWTDNRKLNMLCKIYKNDDLFVRPGNGIKSALVIPDPKN